jgi:hypothetical protein
MLFTFIKIACIIWIILHYCLLPKFLTHQWLLFTSTCLKAHIYILWQCVWHSLVLDRNLSKFISQNAASISLIYISNKSWKQTIQNSIRPQKISVNTLHSLLRKHVLTNNVGQVTYLHLTLDINIIFSGVEYLQCRITFLPVNKVQLTHKNTITLLFLSPF